MIGINLVFSKLISLLISKQTFIVIREVTTLSFTCFLLNYCFQEHHTWLDNLLIEFNINCSIIYPDDHIFEYEDYQDNISSVNSSVKLIHLITWTEIHYLCNHIFK